STHSVLAASATTVLLAKKRVLGFIALALTVCIAFSRLYLYVHYPTDVLCGLLLGVLCGIAALLIAKALKLETRLSKTRAS
ncbi:MAG: phosphatase PAP2 family protein, partial [Ruminococcus sp.]